MGKPPFIGICLVIAGYVTSVSSQCVLMKTAVLLCLIKSTAADTSSS